MGNLKEKLFAVASANDPSALERISHAIEDELLESTQVPEETFNALAELLDSSSFLAMDKSWYLLKVFEYELPALSKAQSQQLASILLRVLPKFSDLTSCYLSAELLVELMSDAEVLAAFKALRDSDRSGVRATIVHGFELLGKAAKNQHARSLVLAELSHMVNDSDSEVAEDAARAERLLSRPSN